MCSSFRSCAKVLLCRLLLVPWLRRTGTRRSWDVLIILVQTSSTDTQLLMQEAIHFLVAAVTTVCLLGFPLLPRPLRSSCSGQRRQRWICLLGWSPLGASLSHHGFCGESSPEEAGKELWFKPDISPHVFEYIDPPWSSWVRWGGLCNFRIWVIARDYRS